MAARNFWAATQATGVVDGLSVYADGSDVMIGEGIGYHCGRKLTGAWRLECEGLDGWQFVQLAPAGATVGPRAHEQGLTLAALWFSGGRVCAMRDLGQRLNAWEWADSRGAICWAPGRQVVVVRAQGAIDVGGLWEAQPCMTRLHVGGVLAANELVISEASFIDPADAGTALIVETMMVV